MMMMTMIVEIAGPMNGLSLDTGFVLSRLTSEPAGFLPGLWSEENLLANLYLTLSLSGNLPDYANCTPPLRIRAPLFHPDPMKASVSLTGHWSKFISLHLQAGRYGTVSEMVRAGLSLLESSLRTPDPKAESRSEGSKPRKSPKAGSKSPQRPRPDPKQDAERSRPGAGRTPAPSPRS